MADFKIEFYSELSAEDLASSDTEGIIQNIIADNESKNPNEILDLLIEENLIKQMDYGAVPYKIARLILAITNIGNYYIFIVKRDSDLDRGYCVFNAGDGTAIKSRNIAEHIAFKIKEVKQRGYFYAMPLEFRQSAQNSQILSTKTSAKAGKSKSPRKIVSYHPPARHLPKPVAEKAEKKKTPPPRPKKREDIVPWGGIDGIDESKFPKIIPKGERIGTASKEKNEEDIPYQLAKRNEQWQYFYELLAAFRNEKGHSNVPTSHDAPLAAWVYRQRHKKHRLDQSQIDKLNDLDFDWAVKSSNPAEKIKRRNTHSFSSAAPARKSKKEKWDEMFRLLKTYYEQHGNCNVRHSEEVDLFTWMRKQRISKEHLSTEQITALDGLQFNWFVSHNPTELPDHALPNTTPAIDLSDEDWDRNFERIKAFYENYGHTNLKKHDVSLARWAMLIRQSRKKRQLSRAWIEKLDSIGFLWHVAKPDKEVAEQIWNKYYQKLSDYYEQHHTSTLPDDYKNEKLVKWCKKQRLLFGRGMLQPEQIERLSAIGFLWVA